MKHNPEHFAGSPASSPWQQEWLEHYSCDLPTCVPYPCTPLSVLLERAARRLPDRAACTLYGRSTTYAELDDRPAAWPRPWSDLGAGPGRHVGLLLPNIPEYLDRPAGDVADRGDGPAAQPAHGRRGGRSTGSRRPAATSSSRSTCSRRTCCRSLGHGPLEHVVVTSLAERLAMWRGWLYRIERATAAAATSAARRRPAAPLRDHCCRPSRWSAPSRSIRREDVAVLAPTGGTTASPKAVDADAPQPGRPTPCSCAHWCGGEDGAEGVLGVLPFFHSYGLSVSAAGVRGPRRRPCTCTRASRPRPVLHVIEKQRPDDRPGGAGDAGGAERADCASGRTTCRSSAR